MLRTIRQAVAGLFFTGITLLFLDVTGALHSWFGWLAKVQLIPAIMSMNIVVILVIVGLTLLFGRIYCSIICPLGVAQDGISFFSGRRRRKKSRFHYAKAKTWLRFSIFIVPGVHVLFEPYSIYGRIVSNVLSPLYRWGNNLLAWFAERANSYAFYSVDVWFKGWIVFGITVFTLILISVLAWRSGRTYCNTICPVGTILELLSRFSLFQPAIDAEKCTQCGVCSRNCKSSCIDVKGMKIDRSRCVVCFNCLDKCKFGAIKYKPRRRNKVSIPAPPEAGNSGLTRSAFLSIAGLLATTHILKAQQLHVDGGLAEIGKKKRPDRKTPIIPPGAQSSRNMNVRCTACQLCISACRNRVLRPSGKLSTLMQPEMTYESGYCRPECTECSQICPNGAIQPVTVPQKTGIAIGQAVWIKENCIVNTDDVQCNACQRNCPTGAIMQVARDPGLGKSLKIPVVDKEICIGCGACEYTCPARPFSAIYVEGYVRHHDI
jgi:ferredoxin